MSTTEYIEVPLNDAVQRFYVGSTARMDGYTDTFTIVALHPEVGAITCDNGSRISASNAGLRVLSVPREVMDAETSEEKVAPFALNDEYGYADEEFWWSYQEAYTAAEEHSLYIKADVYVNNVYNNDVSFVEYIPDFEDEDEDEDEDDE